jgi:predicted HicB family RNase H-like nuclease
VTTKKSSNSPEVKTFRVNLAADLHKRIKIQAAKEERTIQEFVTEALKVYLKGRR